MYKSIRILTGVEYVTIKIHLLSHCISFIDLYIVIPHFSMKAITNKSLVPYIVLIEWKKGFLNPLVGFSVCMIVLGI